jgi:hypothetical protein
LNLLKAKQNDRRVAIATTVDSIISPGLSKIVSVFKDTSNHVSWIFRKVTPEEAVVLDYKKRQIEYMPTEIKWDSTKTLFFETIVIMLNSREYSIHQLYKNSR